MRVAQLGQKSRCNLYFTTFIKARGGLKTMMVQEGVQCENGGNK